MTLDVELLRAWYWAFPFGAEAFHGRVYALHRETRGAIADERTRALAQEADRWVSVRAHGRSVDSLVQLRLNAWFDLRRDADDAAPLRTEVGLATLLAHIAESVLDFDGARVVLRECGHAIRGAEHSEFAHQAARFRWLSLLFPPDVLVAALCAKRSISPRNIDVHFGSKGLASVLARGVAETHMHVNNGVDPRQLWRWLLDDVERPRERKPSADDPFAPPLESIDAFIDACTSAALVHPLLRSLFRDPNSDGAALVGAFDAWIDSDPLARRARLAAVHQLVGERRPLDDRQRVELRAALGLARAMAAQRAQRSGGGVREADQVASDGSYDEEFALTVRGLASLLAAERRAPTAAQALSKPQRLFLQYLRLRIAAYRYTTQEPGVSGLDWFVYWDRRLRALYPDGQRARAVAHAFALHQRAVPLSAMEVRLVPPDDVADGVELFVRTLDAALDAIHGMSVRDAAHSTRDEVLPDAPSTRRAPCEVGVVLHFIKEPLTALPAARSREPAVYGDATQREWMRSRPWLLSNFARADAVSTLIRRHPLLLLLVRGFDVAAGELSMPTWPAIAVIARARAGAIEACNLARAQHGVVELEAPRVTFHVGEDFRRSIEGLRRVHELIEFGAVRSDDRLGHALVLGDDVERRAREQPVVYQPAEERLDDLLWEIDRYRTGDLLDVDGRLPALEAEALQLAKQTLVPGDVQKHIDLQQLIQARRARHDAALITRCARHPERAKSELAKVPLLHAYLLNRASIERGQAPVRVECSAAETAFALRAQRWLRETIATRQITIESNPSSNLLIGDYRSFLALPTFRMRPLPSQKAEMPTLQLSINSDDPLTFATHVGREFEYMFASLLRAGVATEDALAWIDGVRECGHRSRFTLPASRDPRVLMRLRNQLQPYTLFDLQRR